MRIRVYSELHCPRALRRTLLVAAMPCGEIQPHGGFASELSAAEASRPQKLAKAFEVDSADSDDLSSAARTSGPGARPKKKAKESLQQVKTELGKDGKAPPKKRAKDRAAEHVRCKSEVELVAARALTPLRAAELAGQAPRRELREKVKEWRRESAKVNGEALSASPLGKAFSLTPQARWRTAEDDLPPPPKPDEKQLAAALAAAPAAASVAAIVSVCAAEERRLPPPVMAPPADPRVNASGTADAMMQFSEARDLSPIREASRSPASSSVASVEASRAPPAGFRIMARRSSPLPGKRRASKSSSSSATRARRTSRSSSSHDSRRRRRGGRMRSSLKTANRDGGRHGSRGRDARPPQRRWRKKAAGRSRSPSGRRIESPRWRSRSLSSEGSDADRPLEDPDVTRMTFAPAQAAFLMGKSKGDGEAQGGAIRAAARASGADTTLKKFNRILDLRGGERERTRAQKYIGFVLEQMAGPIRLNDSRVDRDCSMVEVPDKTIGFVTGINGKNLRSFEDEWGVVMMFVEYTGKEVKPAAGGSKHRFETLAIFGPRQARRAAQLTVMGFIEEKLPYHFSKRTRDTGDTYDSGDLGGANDDWGTTTVEIKESIVPYALGKNGTTLKKIRAAAGCAVQYVGTLAFFSGNKPERTRGKEYLTWLLQTLEGPVYVENFKSRTDVTVVDVPGPAVGFVTGTRRETMSRYEEEFGVMMIFHGHHGQRGTPPLKEDVVKLLIFGKERSRKCAQIDICGIIEFRNKGFCTRHMPERKSYDTGFDEERILLNEAKVSYSNGTRGATRKKLASASGAHINFVGFVCCIVGTIAERQRCKDYLGWLLAKLEDSPGFIDIRGRTDVTELWLGGLNNKAVGVVTGKKGHTLQEIGEATGCWCIVAKDHTGVERLCIFNYDAGGPKSSHGRWRAARLFKATLREAKMLSNLEASEKGQAWDSSKRGYWPRGGRRHGSGSGGGHRGDHHSGYGGGAAWGSGGKEWGGGNGGGARGSGHCPECGEPDGDKYRGGRQSVRRHDGRRGGGGTASETWKGESGKRGGQRGGRVTRGDDSRSPSRRPPMRSRSRPISRKFWPRSEEQPPRQRRHDKWGDKRW